MTFLAPTLLFGLLAAAIPVVIHLLNRRRHRTMPWAAMQFLLKATRESRGKKRLRHLLILLFRALAIAALVIAIARPVAGGLLGWGVGGVDTVILLLDRSASMEATADGVSKRQAVLDQVRESMQELESARLVLIDSASGRAQEVPSPETLGELSATAATDSQADIPGLLSRALDLIVDGSTGRTEIWLASDLQKADWRPDDPRWESVRAGLASLPQPPRLRILGRTATTAADTAIRVVAARRSGENLTLEIELVREDVQPLALPVTTHLDGAGTAETVSVTGQIFRFRKILPLNRDDAGGHGWVSIPADGNPRNNVAFFAYGKERAVRVALVAEPGEAAEILALAAAPPGLPGRVLEIAQPEDAGFLDDERLALVVWQEDFPTGPAADRLLAYVRGGGQALFFPPGEPSDASFAGMRWGEVERSEAERFFVIGDWARDEGPLRNGADGTPIPADRLKAIQRQNLEGDALPLAAWDDGSPFLARKVTEAGTALFVGTIPNYGWSNLGDADVLLPLVQRAIEAGAERLGSALMVPVGSRKGTAAPGETRDRIDSHAQDSSPHQAGVFRIGNEVLAVNRPWTEDTPERVPEDGLDLLFDGTDYSLFESPGDERADSLVREVWRSFLVAMLLFLIAEALLSLNPKPAVTASTPLRPTHPAP